MPFELTSRSSLRLRRALVAALLAVASAAPAGAWWDRGHRHITAGAIDILPLPLRGFFSTERSDIVFLAGTEPPGTHYIDIDWYPEFHAGEFPRDVNVLIARHGVGTVNSLGRGPWTYANYVATLSQGMAAAQTPADWAALVPTAAAMAHYIEDLHNPLHLTLNYNGQLTGQDGIHARYEGEMIDRHIAELAIEPFEPVHLPSVIDFVFDGIENHHPFVAEILAADAAAPKPYNTSYYNALWTETGDFTKTLFQEAARAVASSWYTAWVNAGSPRTFLEHSADFDASGAVNGADLALWTAAYGATGVADANSDGGSDGGDFLAWQLQVGANATAAVRPVPEPAAALLGLLALLAAFQPPALPGVRSKVWRRARPPGRAGG